MGILALNEGLVGIFAIAFHISVVCIHGATDVTVASIASLLILCGTAVVISLDPIVRLLKVGAVTSLITQAPEDD